MSKGIDINFLLILECSSSHFQCEKYLKSSGEKPEIVTVNFSRLKVTFFEKNIGI